MNSWARLALSRVATRQSLALGVIARADCPWAGVIPTTSAQAGGLVVAVSQ